MSYKDDLIERQNTQKLSKVLGLNEDIVESLELTSEVDSERVIGSYYTEFPEKDNVEPSILKKLKSKYPEEFKKIPFGKTEYYISIG